MRALIRKTCAGSEYWDTEEKRTILVPNGQEPNFDFVMDPPSLLNEDPPAEKKEKPESDQKDSAAAVTDEVAASEKDDSYITDSEEELDAALRDEDEMGGPDFSSMTIKDMKKFAQTEKIEIPKTVTKRDDIMELLSDEMMERQLEE